MKKIVLSLMLLFLPTVVLAGQWTKAVPLTTDDWVDFPTDNQANNDALERVLSDLNTVRLTYGSASTIVASAGSTVISNAAGTIRLMMNQTSASNITFSNIDTGSEASSTTYYVYCGTSTASDESCTYYISTSSSAPTGVTYYKRLGSFYNNSSSNIVTINNDNIYELGDWETKTITTVYQATTNGFVVAIAASQDVSDSRAGFNILSDGSSSPSTVRCGAYAFYHNAFAPITRNTCVVPIKQGDYWQAVISINNNGTHTVYWIPLD